MSQELEPRLEDMVEQFLSILGIKKYTKDVEKEVLSYIDRYVNDVIEDAWRYSSHSEKQTVDESDITLAIELLQEQNPASAPSPEIFEASSCSTRRYLSEIELLHSLPQQHPSSEKLRLSNISSIHSRKEMCIPRSCTEETNQGDPESIWNVLKPL